MGVEIPVIDRDDDFPPWKPDDPIQQHAADSSASIRPVDRKGQHLGFFPVPGAPTLP